MFDFNVLSNQEQPKSLYAHDGFRAAESSVEFKSIQIDSSTRESFAEFGKPELLGKKSIRAILVHSAFVKLSRI